MDHFKRTTYPYPDLKIWRKSLPTSASPLNNVEIGVQADGFFVSKCHASMASFNNQWISGWHGLAIRLNDIKNDPIEFEEGLIVEHPIKRIYLHGSSASAVYGRGYFDDIEIVFFKKPFGTKFFTRYETGWYAQQYASGNDTVLPGLVIGIYVESFGDLVFYPKRGNSWVTINDVPAGTYLTGINPSIISNLSTVNAIIFYRT